jgi:uncharacterized protein (DUF58 family)
MFGKPTLVFLILLLAVAVISRESPLFFFALALVLADGASRLWRRYCLTRLEYSRRLIPNRVEFGGTATLEIEVVNRKLLPLPWLQIEEETPRELSTEHREAYSSHKLHRSVLSALVLLRPYERVRRRYRIPCEVRGEHEFGPTRLTTGDLFGLYSRTEYIESTDDLVVYPRVVPLAELGLPPRRPLGDLRTRSWIFEDPTRLAGVREYRPGDSLRRIHWPATARTGELQARVYEPSTTHKLMIFLNVRNMHGWGFEYDPEVVELTVTTAASISAWAIESGYQVGLASNGSHRGRELNVGLPPAGDAGQLDRMLETLGRLQPFAAASFDTILTRESRRLTFGDTVIAITAGLADDDTDALLALRRRGHPVSAVLTGRHEEQMSLDGITVRRVGPPESWLTAETLSPT